MATTHSRGIGIDFMDPNSCGRCDACDELPAPVICEDCCYDEEGNFVRLVEWPCSEAKAAKAA